VLEAVEHVFQLASSVQVLVNFSGDLGWYRGLKAVLRTVAGLLGVFAEIVKVFNVLSFR
jgi:hypothetical protein